MSKDWSGYDRATLIDTVSVLMRNGFRWDSDYQRFERGSWYAYVKLQKNGFCRVRVL